jgi:hypothetical protein
MTITQGILDFPSDAVIRHLAVRAETDSKLKAVSKSVAAGEASEKQLKVFRARSDELKAVVDEYEYHNEDEGEDDMTEELFNRKVFEDQLAQA